MSNRAFWEGRYIDPWSAAHLISGALVAYVLLRLGFGFWAALCLSVVIAIAWEVFEKVTQLSDTEHFTNNLTDIIFAQVGFIPGYRAFQTFSASMSAAITLIFLALFVAIVIVGWMSYTYYRCSAPE